MAICYAVNTHHTIEQTSGIFTMVCLTIAETLWFTNIFPSNRVLKWSRQIHIATSKKIEKHTTTITTVGFYFFPFFSLFSIWRLLHCLKKVCVFWMSKFHWRFSCLVSPPVFHHGLPILKMLSPSIFIIWGLSSWMDSYNPYLSMTRNPYLSMVL